MRLENQMITFINLTEHNVSVLGDDNEVLVTFYPALNTDTDNPVRVPMTSEDLGYFDVDCTCAHVGEIADTGDEETGPNAQVVIVRTAYGSVENLPAPQPETLYIVSSMIQANCPERQDLVVPAPLVRNDEGEIIGCQGFSLLAD